MLVTGDPIDAPTASEWGLINRVVPAERYGDETPARPPDAESSPLTISIGKQAFYAQIDLDRPSLCVLQRVIA